MLLEWEAQWQERQTREPAREPAQRPNMHACPTRWMATGDAGCEQRLAVAAERGEARLLAVQAVPVTRNV